MHELGVRRGDVIAVSLPNDTGVVISFHAAMRLGVVWLGVNRALAAPEKRFILDDSNAQLLLADESVARGLRESGVGSTAAKVIVSGGEVGEWQALTASAGNRYPRATVDVGDAAGIAYTSGTTGRPKAVVHSQRNLLLPGAVLVEARGYDASLRRGDCAALTILNLQVTSTLLSAQAGGTQIVMDRVDATGIASWIRSERINSWFGVPTMLHDLASSSDIAREDLATLEDIWTGGTYCPVQIRERFEAKFGKRVHATYGLTEVPTVVSIEPRNRGHVDRASGQPLPHLVVEIRDADRNTLPVGGVGEVTVRARDDWAGELYQPMLGYQGAEGATAAAVRDGVLYTGDVGELDRNGNLLVHDRSSALILRGGANVYPTEVERVILEVDGVAGVAVVGCSDERLGQRVAAAIEATPGALVDVELLEAHCRRQLARYKVPDRWLLRKLPRNAMGKVVRVEVEGWFAEP
jgi:acyl-CoA synthetase (AMP-forming)/AMP-acid ligase II